MKADVIKQADSVLKKIPVHYDLKISELKTIKEYYKTDYYSMICAAFRCGYVRGTHAEQAKRGRASG